MNPKGSPAGGIWAARPMLSRLLRLAIVTVPILVGLASTWAASKLLDVPSTFWAKVAWWLMLLAVGTASTMVIERLARKLIPLAMLLKLSMLFPDRAPSRFRVARQANSTRSLQDSLEADGGQASAQDGAEKVLALVTALSAHDRHTRGHAERVRVFTDMLTKELKLPEEDRYRLRWAALLHDIGKLSVRAEILNKPGKLDADEWVVIRSHPSEGVRLAESLMEWLDPWGQAIQHHHERYDGNGYPDGLAADSISYGGRIVSVADTYDTMTSARSYKKASATKTAREELVACAGTQFDPEVVRAFLSISLPQLLWATGPVSLLVHLPFLARLQQIGQASAAAAAQTAAATAVAGVTAISLVGPAGPREAHAAQDLPRQISSWVDDDFSHRLDPWQGQSWNFAPGSGGQGHGGASSPDEDHAPPADDPSGNGGGGGGGEPSGGDEGDEEPTGGDGTGGGDGGGDTGGGDGGGDTGGGDTGGGDTGGGDDGGGDDGGGDTGGGDSSAAQAHIANLRSAVSDSDVEQKVIEKLLKELDDASADIGEGDPDKACQELDHFAKKVDDAATGSHSEIDPSVAAAWIAEAADIKAVLAC